MHSSAFVPVSRGLWVSECSFPLDVSSVAVYYIDFGDLIKMEIVWCWGGNALGPFIVFMGCLRTLISSAQRRALERCLWWIYPPYSLLQAHNVNQFISSIFNPCVVVEFCFFRVLQAFSNSKMASSSSRSDVKSPQLRRDTLSVVHEGYGSTTRAFITLKLGQKVLETA